MIDDITINKILKNLSICLQRRKQNRFRSNRRWFICLCLLVLLSAVFIVLTNDRYLHIAQIRHLRRWFFKPSEAQLRVISARYGKFLNRSNVSFTDSSASFQSSISPYHPHLPILLFTQNFSSLKNTSKLILLANEFFDDKKWGLNSLDQSSAAIMTHLSCPFLSDYCDITTDNYLFPYADAVVYHVRNDIDQWDANELRRPDQRFVFALWESPSHTPDLKPFKNFFNWTMTYRSQSDIIASYYFGDAYLHKSSAYYQLMMEENVRKNLQLQLNPMDYQLSDELFANKRMGTAAALISNCGGGSRRLRLVILLRRYIDVKVYGKCGSKCPADVDCREFIAKNYYFFFSFENNLCQDYTTEKFFGTLRYPIVPVVYGRTNYSHLLPSSAFIDANEFDSIRALAKYLNETRYNKEKYLSYFTWKKDYVWGLTQFFTPLCDLCVRLHLDSTPKIIDDIDVWWKTDTCQPPRKFKL